MLQQILRVADAQLAKIVVHRHARLGAELLAQGALAALLLLAKLLQHKASVQAARKGGDQLVEQRLLFGGARVVGGVTVAFEGHHQLGEQQLCHLICQGIALLALLLQLGDNLAHRVHAVTA